MTLIQINHFLDEIEINAEWATIATSQEDLDTAQTNIKTAKMMLVREFTQLKRLATLVFTV